jgi:toxin-antitoxin system PIN domain toxin
MIVDANVLIYAVDEASPHHQVAKDWWEAAVNGPRRVGVPGVSLMAFQRIMTHPRASTHPLAVVDAWSHIVRWLACPSVWVPGPGPHHSEILGRLLEETDARGNLVTDAHLAALAVEHGVRICSFDSDFARFPEACWYQPRPAEDQTSKTPDPVQKPSPPMGS